MPDPLHWLGVTKIHRFISMSDMKYDAIVSTVRERERREEMGEACRSGKTDRSTKTTTATCTVANLVSPSVPLVSYTPPVLNATGLFALNVLLSF